jgi:hypothetical protein
MIYRFLQNQISVSKESVSVGQNQLNSNYPMCVDSRADLDDVTRITDPSILRIKYWLPIQQPVTLQSEQKYWRPNGRTHSNYSYIPIIRSVSSKNTWKRYHVNYYRKLVGNGWITFADIIPHASVILFVLNSRHVPLLIKWRHCHERIPGEEGGM